MEIKTKYNIGDEVWMHLSDEFICGRIIEVRTYTTKKQSKVFYEVFAEDESFSMMEQWLFPTKEELLKSL